MKGLQINLYWYCQLFGWGAAALYWAYYLFNTGSLSTGLACLSVLMSFSLGILASHGYKLLSHRHRWHLKPIKDLLPIMMMGTLALLVIYVVGNFFLSICIHQLSLNKATAVLILPGMVTGGLRYNAIWILAFHLYHYAKRESAIEVEKTKLENEAIKAQLHQLTAELNPHFLFNSLNSIKALVNHEPQQARHAIVLLSEILRHALHLSKKESITLAEELEQVEKYLQLEKIRFEERLEFTFDISPQAKSASILPFTLLNLVENAIKHGISQNINGGDINISVHIVGGDLKMEVHNTGQLANSPYNGNGIGIKNIKERLQLLHGSRAHFDVFNTNTYQVTAIIQIPLSYV
jgi:sensor histidine kinase YesM